MQKGKIRSIFSNRKKTLALIEYDRGNKLIVYQAADAHGTDEDLTVGDQVSFTVRSSCEGSEAHCIEKICTY